MRTTHDTLGGTNTADSANVQSGKSKTVLFAGLDIGSTATKAALIDGDSQQVVAVAEKARDGLQKRQHGTLWMKLFPN